MTDARRLAVLALTLLALAAASARAPGIRVASGTIAGANWPYLPGSLFPLRVNGFAPPYDTELLGPGRLLPGATYAVPQNARPGSAVLVAGNAAGLAAATLRIAAPPSPARPFLVVASYDDGLFFHDLRSFSVLGALATGGVPSDVAMDAAGRVATTDTQGSALTLVTLAPWNVARAGNVPLGDEIAVDGPLRALFVTNRDTNGGGALTRVGASGGVTRVGTGETAEGVAVDERRQLVYVANANDGTVAQVDARTMRIRKRFPAVARIFSLALSPDGARLYGVSNQSAGSPFAAPGAVVAIALADGRPHVVRRSAPLAFPLGIAIDATGERLFVTDEELGRIYVLDARTLRPIREPLETCATPWKPTLDARDGRLYVPCARADEVDAFDVRTMQRVAHAPFATGGYPLAVAVWHPREK